MLMESVQKESCLAVNQGRGNNMSKKVRKNDMETARLAQDDICKGMKWKDAVDKYGYKDEKQLILSIIWTNIYDESI